VSVRLKGMTWAHPRGYAPMMATSKAWTVRHPDVTIEWDKRSLQAFGDFPLEQLAEMYDLLVIDHPHVGICAQEKTLLPLNQPGREAELAELAEHALGSCHESYFWEGNQWALAIDAASQVSVWRPDLLPNPPQTWDDVRKLARTGCVLWPLKPIDAIMSFFSLAAGCGVACPVPGELVTADAGEAILKFMADVAKLLPDICLEQSPIDVLELLSHHDRFSYCPLLFCYSNYARPGFRPHRLVFGDVPKSNDEKLGLGILGGTGLAISAHCRHREVALDYAYWVAGSECQRTLYFASGGQPAHLLAWLDPEVNRASHNFFQTLCPSLHRAWLRPRHAGYLNFQDRAGEVINDFLRTGSSAAATVRELRSAYHESFNVEG